MTQLQLKGLEVCNFKCLTDCPVPPGTYADTDCIWDDPLIGMFDRIEYSEFELWRDEHGELACPEPKDPSQTRCPRCFSTKFVIGYPYMECRHCGYSEPLIDFPISHYYHLALTQEFNDNS